MIVLLHGLMEVDNQETASWIAENRDVFKEIEVTTKSLSVEKCWEVVKAWDECDDRGDPHINDMCESIKQGYELPPIVHCKEGFPLDGRHRITAFRKLGIEHIQSINLEHLKNEVQKIITMENTHNNNIENSHYSDDMVEDLDPQEKLTADLAGVQDPNTRALIILRNTLEMGTDALNGSGLPDALLLRVSDLLSRVETSLSTGHRTESVLRAASEELSQWLKEEDFGDASQDVRLVKKLLDRSPALQNHAVIRSLMSP